MKDVILTYLVETKQGEEVYAHSLFVFTLDLRFPYLANPPAHVLAAVFIDAYAKYCIRFHSLASFCMFSRHLNCLVRR